MSLYVPKSRYQSNAAQVRIAPLTPPSEPSVPSSESFILDTAKEAPKSNIKLLLQYSRAVLFCMIAAFGGLLFGWDIGTVSGIINMPSFLERFGKQNPETGVYDIQQVLLGVIVAAFNAGALFGGILLSKIGDKFGRKAGIRVNMAVYISGAVLQATSLHHWQQFAGGRFITGLGIGATAVLSPLYISETAPKQVRGTLVSCYQLMITIGILSGYSCVYGTKHFNGDFQWRVPILIMFGWAAVMIVGSFVIPESARFLVQQERFAEADESVARINGTEAGSRETREMVEEIKQAAAREEAEGTATWTEVITGKPRLGYRLFLGVGVQALQQLTGNAYFFYYGTKVFTAVGMVDPFLTSIILGAVNFVSTFIGLYVIDRFGRRLPLLVGSAVMLVALLVYATCGSFFLHADAASGDAPSKLAGNLMITFTCVYIAAFSSTWAPIPFVIVSETYPMRIRAKGISFAIGGNWLMNIWISMSIPYLTRKLGFLLGYVFSGGLFLGLLFTFFFVYETKGLSLEEVDEMYDTKNLQAWQSGKWKPKVVDPEGLIIDDEKDDEDEN